MTAYRVKRDLNKSEHCCNKDLKAGDIIYSYSGCTYGCISNKGAAFTLIDGEGPFFEVQRDLVERIEDITKPTSESTPMTKPFDPTKPVQTCDGLPARVICTNVKNANYPIAAIIQRTSGNETVESYDKNGYFFVDKRESPFNLVNIPKKKTGWINIYHIEGKPLRSIVGANIYPSKEIARKCLSPEPIIDTIQITWEE